MKVLIVCSGNFPEPENNFPIYQAFVYDQIFSIQTQFKIQFDLFLIKGKGFLGYLSNIKKLKKKINSKDFDLVHAHFSLSGLISVICSKTPVIVTFHGSDINYKSLNIISALVSLMSCHNIYVSTQLYQKAYYKPKNYSIIPCGVDFNLFKPQNQNELKHKWKFTPQKKYILFSSSFNSYVKNYPLAKNALCLLYNYNIELLELSGLTRQEVSELMSIVDVALLTSFSEGSPQFIKEAMACNLPIVSTDVGDVKEIIQNSEGCFICNCDPKDVAKKILQAIEFGRKTNGRKNIKHLDNSLIADRIVKVYQKIING